MSNVVIIPSDPDHSVQLRTGVDFRRDIGQEILDEILEFKNLSKFIIRQEIDNSMPVHGSAGNP